MKDNIFELIDNSSDDTALFLGTILNTNGSLAVSYKSECNSPNFATYRKLAFKTTNLSGYIFKSEMIPFHKIYNELEREHNGMLNYFPHNYIANYLLYNFDSKTTKHPIVKIGTRGEDQIELTNNEPFYSPSNVINTLKSRLEFIVQETPFDSSKKRKLVYRESMSSLYSLLSTRKMKDYIVNSTYFKMMEKSKEFSEIQINGIKKFEDKFLAEVGTHLTQLDSKNMIIAHLKFKIVKIKYFLKELVF